MPVVEQGLASGLREAGVLLVALKPGAVCVRLERERCGDEARVLLELLRIGCILGRELVHGGDVLLDPGLLESRCAEVLRGAHEDSRTPLNGRAERGEIAAGDRREEEDG